MICGMTRLRPLSRIATCGGLISGVEYVPPTEPRLLIVNVPPRRISRSNLPSRTVVANSSNSAAICEMLLRSASRITGTIEPAIRVDRDADVDVFLVDDVILFHVHRSVEHRVPLERRGNSLDQKRQRRELDATVAIILHALLTHVFQLGDVGIIEIRELGDGGVRLDHVAGDGLPHSRHLFDPHAAVFVGIRRPGWRDAARYGGGNLLVCFADVGAHILGCDASTGAGRPDTPQLDAQLPGQTPHGRTGGRRSMAVARHIVGAIGSIRGLFGFRRSGRSRLFWP